MKRIRNRVVGNVIDDVQGHWQENRDLYVAGAVGFLLGGFTVLAFSRRSSEVRVVVENKSLYLDKDWSYEKV